VVKVDIIQDEQYRKYSNVNLSLQVNAKETTEEKMKYKFPNIKVVEQIYMKIYAQRENK